jgi:hypothetical protein
MLAPTRAIEPWRLSAGVKTQGSGNRSGFQSNMVLAHSR